MDEAKRLAVALYSGVALGAGAWLAFDSIARLFDYHDHTSPVVGIALGGILIVVSYRLWASAEPPRSGPNATDALSVNPDGTFGRQP